MLSGVGSCLLSCMVCLPSHGGPSYRPALSFVVVMLCRGCTGCSRAHPAGLNGVVRLHIVAREAGKSLPFVSRHPCAVLILENLLLRMKRHCFVVPPIHALMGLLPICGLTAGLNLQP